MNYFMKKIIFKSEIPINWGIPGLTFKTSTFLSFFRLSLACFTETINFKIR